jgi:hypothetical protein
MAKAGSVISAAPPDIYGQVNPSEQRRLATAGKRNASLTASRDVEAQVDACFRAHYAEVLAYALRRLGERGAAEDVAAQTFAVAWRRLDALPADPLPWAPRRRPPRNPKRGPFSAATIAAPRPHYRPAPTDGCCRSRRFGARALGHPRRP